MADWRMSGQNYPENSPEGDWDDKGHIAWNEYDWKRYLDNSNEETSRFLCLYLKMRQEANKLDRIAHIMGWDREDMGETPTDEIQREDPSAAPYIDENLPEPDDFDPYTIHRHPVFIITRALYQHILTELDALLKLEKPHFNARLVHSYHKSLSNAEHNAIMGVNALDMGDFNLCICHLKLAISILNNSLSILQELTSHECLASSSYANDATTAIFDLRELWLRILNECREEFKRDFRD